MGRLINILLKQVKFYHCINANTENYDSHSIHKHVQPTVDIVYIHDQKPKTNKLIANVLL